MRARALRYCAAPRGRALRYCATLGSAAGCFAAGAGAIAEERQAPGIPALQHQAPKCNPKANSGGSYPQFERSNQPVELGVALARELFGELPHPRSRSGFLLGITFF